MRHISNVSRGPARAGVLLPGFPASHPVSFLKEHWPDTIRELVGLVFLHIGIELTEE